MNLRVGDRVVYGIHGVCCILEVETRTVDRKKVEYFVLAPLEQQDARFYIPTQNQAAVSKLRPLLEKAELDGLLKNENIGQTQWIADENQRKQKYRELINSGDRAALIGMVRTLHIHRKTQQKAGRKFHLCDENFLRDAEKLLSTEISVVLDIPRENVREYIHTALTE